MRHPLDGCNEKLNRAREHLEDFAQAQGDYFTPRPFGVRKVYDRASGWYGFVPVLLRHPPLRLGVILGDIVHNLRSALDHLVWQAVLRNDGRPTRAHQFPVCENPQGWDEAARKHLKGVAATDLEAIRAAQPFTVVMKPTPLTRLHRLWNEDKHQIVTPVVGAIGSPFPLPFGVIPLPRDITLVPRRDVGEVRQAEAYVGVPLDGSVPFVRARIVATGPNPDIDLQGGLPSGLMLNDGGLVNHVINDMATAVEQIVNGFGTRWTP